MKVYNNTVVVSTTSTTGYAGYFYYTATYSNNTRIRNNVFVNASTGACLYHYNPIYGSSDFNLIFTNGTANFVQRGTAAATYTSLQAFKSANLTHEQNSIQYRPGYFSATNIAPNPADTSVWAVNGRGTLLPEVTEDFNGIVRPLTIAEGITDLGAYEVTPTSVPPMCTAVPATPVAGGTQAFLFGTDTVCKVIHDISSTAPTSLVVRQYSGTFPPYSTSTDYRFGSYITMTAPAGSYTYNLDYYYKNDWIGSVATESDSRLAQFTTPGPWFAYSGSTSTVDVTKNIISSTFLGTYSIFTGTDGNAPLPVELVEFNGYLSNLDAVLVWQTAMEKNSANFQIERAYEIGKFVTVGELSAAGNSNAVRNYLFQDNNALNEHNVAYYRLKMVDRDGSFAYSKIISVRKVSDESVTTIGPNPFKNNFVVYNVMGKHQIEVMDINGKTVYTTELEGNGESKVNLPHSLGIGVYFIKVTSSTKQNVFKMIKE
jgi:hypothetical protein